LVRGSYDAYGRLLCRRMSAQFERAGQADVILSNSDFTARVFKSYFPSIRQTPTTVYPGINISAYETPIDASHPDIVAISSSVVCAVIGTVLLTVALAGIPQHCYL
jgi:GH25 family lysozyme M1 (1,4-beta-N-acetylmuramidase)